MQQVLDSTGHALRVINLSQLEGPAELSSALAEVARWATGKTPVVFFDEFDSGLAGTPLGWLQWLLAPMQDGVVVYHGHAIEMKCAVFVFAEGTADTFEEFPEAHGGYFRSAKGTGLHQPVTRPRERPQGQRVAFPAGPPRHGSPPGH